MSAARLLAATLVCIGLAGCSDRSESEVPAAKDSVAEGLQAPMDKARSVEDTSMQHKEELDRALDSAENSH